MIRFIFLMLFSWMLTPSLQAQYFDWQNKFTICPEELGWSEMVLGDIDGDGDLDLVADSYRYPGYYLNNGDGTYSERVDIVFEYPFQERGNLNLVDIDSDSDLDIVMTTGGLTAEIIILSNDGLGNFSTPVLISTIDTRATSLDIVDLDQDGDLDILASIGVTFAKKMAWYENDGNGQFSAQQVIIDESNRLALSGDIDNDGDHDILRYEPSIGLLWLENNGAMDFGNEHSIAITTGSSLTMHLLDLDGDEDLDVFLPEANMDEAIWYANDGSGNFVLGQSFSELGELNHTIAVDIDDDGDMDIIARPDEGLSLLINDGNGSFSPQAPISTEQDAARRFVAGDVDNDGDMDVIDSWFNDGIFLHTFDDDLSSVRTSLNDFVTEPEYSYAADLDGDGDLDALSTSYFGNQVSWYENPGLDGSSSWSKTIITTDIEGPNIVLSEDINLDGDMDIIVASGNSPFYMENQGDGNFGLESLPGTWSGGTIRNMVLNDLDNDGDFDILYNRVNASVISWSENLGDGSFADMVDLLENVVILDAVEAMDLDGDGLKDLLFSSSIFDHVSWSQNLGSNLFGQVNLIHDGTVRGSHAGDFDNDGDNDIICGNSFDDEILLFKNEGNGYFCAPRKIAFPSGVVSLLPTDVDLDGDLDILFNGSFAGVYYNDGEAMFNELDFFIFSNTSQFLESTFPFDMDDDGDMDVLYTSNGSDDIGYYINRSNEGCMDPSACNYDPTATADSNNCCYEACGCTDQLATNYNEDADCDDGSCEYVQGCTDPIADNFNPSATSDDGSCQYIFGCTNPLANNYNPDATMDDCNCLYDIQGSVFFDSNENGLLDGTENLLPNQQVLLMPDSIFGYTNEEGNFNFSDVDYGNYELVILNDTIFPFNTTDSLLSFSFYQSTLPTLLFGVSDDEALHQLDVLCLPFLNPLPCGEQNTYTVRVHNTGNQILDGSITFTYDSLYGTLTEITPFDSINDYTVYTSFSDLEPGEILYHSYGLETPDFNFIGDTVHRTATVWAGSGSDTLAFGQSLRTNIVACSYDPNDKLVFPQGYGENHYVHPDSTLHYVIRFQNTGNAPALDVIVRDTISTLLDLTTISAVTSSHESFMTVDYEAGVVEFDFPDILLPGSMDNEEESQGFVSFRIDPKEDLPLLTELNNTAEIYFDNNPPIITNTTWSTLYDCSLFEVDFVGTDAILTASPGDNYQWHFNGIPIPGATEQQYEATENGEYSVEIGIDFPCTAMTNPIFIMVTSISELEGELLSLFPNPMTRSTVLNVGKFRGSCQLRLIDISGKVVRQKELFIDSELIEIEREDLNAGQYVLELKNDEESAQIMFIVQ